MKKIILTGIRATGIPHIGNYYGAIKPLIEMQHEHRVFQLIADLHSIPHVRDQTVMNENIRTITACYLACGLDINHSVLWRQSQIKEMAWISFALMSLTTAGELDSLIDLTNNKSLDMVSCLYPVLMAADTLMMGADLVYAGRDHLHGLEFVRKLAQKFNEVYGAILTAPEPIFSSLTEMVKGLDGRKMSKSFGNTISILDPEDVLKEKINGLQGETETESFATLVDLMSYSVSDAELDKIKGQILLKKMSLSQAKAILFEILNGELKPIRSKFDQLMEQPDYLDQVLLDGLHKAKEQGAQRMQKMLHAVGLSFN